jgi:hypothetical protein
MTITTHALSSNDGRPGFDEIMKRVAPADGIETEEGAVGGVR